MRKLLIILFFGAVSITCAKLYHMPSEELLLIENDSNEESYSLGGIETAVIAYKEVLNSDSDRINNGIEQAKSSSDLLPHEVPIWNVWAEERGYDLNGDLTNSYNSLSDEILLSLAEQNDPKAHYILAGRILLAQSNKAEGISSEAVIKVEGHLHSASMLGYTSTLNVLTDLALRKASAGESTKNDMIIAAYKFALTGIRRGDQNSESILSSLKLMFPISDDDYSVATASSIDFYNELSEKRSDLGLPVFNNSTPPEVVAFTMRAR